jgi:hypothetical protein
MLVSEELQGQQPMAGKHKSVILGMDQLSQDSIHASAELLPNLPMIVCRSIWSKAFPEDPRMAGCNPGHGGERQSTINHKRQGHLVIP